MSLNFFATNEDYTNDESINKYEDIFEEFVKNCPTLKEALQQMFISSGASKDKANQLAITVYDDVKAFIEPKFKDIKNKYPNVTLEDAFIISSYTYEFENETDYNTYKLLNTNLVSNNRKQGIKKVSKYLFILLKALRKLDRYYPKKNLYRCIPVLVKLDYDSFNNKFVPYLEGKQKCFWAFTSTSHDRKKCYEFLGTTKKSGTIFSLTGNIWGYDISLFNICKEDEILLEPERKFLIEESLPEVNDIIYVRCFIRNSPIVLESFFKDIDIKGFIDKYKCNIKNKNINTLDLSGKKIGNEGFKVLIEIEEFKELKELYLYRNNIKDIKELKNAKFNKLEKLYLYYNKISDINILEKVNFKELKQLGLLKNKISDIKVLENVDFKELEILDLSENLITDITVLEKVNFKDLKQLYLRNNNISDIKVFQNVKFNNLEILCLSENKISDINILEKVNFRKLEELYLRDNNISEIEVFLNDNFDKLERLYLQNNLIDKTKNKDLITLLIIKIVRNNIKICGVYI